MPRVIANKLTGEVMPDTAENRIKKMMQDGATLIDKLLTTNQQ